MNRNELEENFKLLIDDKRNVIRCGYLDNSELEFVIGKLNIALKGDIIITYFIDNVYFRRKSLLSTPLMEEEIEDLGTPINYSIAPMGTKLTEIFEKNIHIIYLKNI